MDQPIVAQKAPYGVELEAGKTYWWCRCGRSASQPYCDGSHAGTGIEPLEFTPPASRKAWLCGCKATARGPFCDGAHNKLP